MPTHHAPRPQTLVFHALEPRTLFSFPADYAGQLVSDGDIHVAGVAADPWGNVFITGTFANTADFDLSPRRVTQLDAADGPAFVARYLPDGTLHWVRQFGAGAGTVTPRAIGVDHWGTPLLAGDFTGTPDLATDPTVNVAPTANGNSDAFAMKLYPKDGITRFVNWIATPADESVVGVATNLLGEVVVAGNYALAPGVAERGFVARYTGGGSGKFLATFGDGTVPAHLTAIAVDPTHAMNVYVAGLASAGVDLDPSATASAPLTTESHFLVKLDGLGDYQWHDPLAPSGVDLAHMATDTAGNLFVAGAYSGSFDFNPSSRRAHYLDSAGATDAFLAKYTPAGALAFAKSMGGTLADGADGLAIDPVTGDAVVTGSYHGKTYFNPGLSAFRLYAVDASADAFVARFSGAGLFRDAARIGVGFFDDAGPHVSIGGLGDIHLAGVLRGSIDCDPGPAIRPLVNSHDADDDAYLVKGAYLP